MVEISRDPRSSAYRRMRGRGDEEVDSRVRNENESYNAATTTVPVIWD